MPQFVLLLHDAGNFDPNISPDQMQAIIQRYVDWRRRVQNGRAVTGHKLRDGEGRVMRGSGASVKVTDGPYAEGREVIGGLFVIDGTSYDEVLDLCKDCPHLEFGTIEIREVEPTS